MALNKSILKQLLRKATTSIATTLPTDDLRPVRIFSGPYVSKYAAAHPALPEDVRTQLAESPDTTIALVDEGVESASEFVAECMKDDIIGEFVSAESVLQEFQALLGLVLFIPQLTDDDLELPVRSALKSLRSKVGKHTIYFPISNLALQDLPEVKVGDVVFFPFPPKQEEVRAAFAATIESSAAANEAREAFLGKLDGEILPFFSSHGTCAKVSVDGDAGRATERARNLVNASLNLLRCFTFIINPRQEYPVIGFGAMPGVHSKISMRVSCAPPMSCAADIRFVGPRGPYVLSPERLKKLTEKFCFDRLSQTIGKPQKDRTTLESSVVTAIRWLGRGIVAEEPPDKVASLAIGLERLLTDKSLGESDIADRCARTLAYLVADAGNQQFAIYRAAKRLYGLRSDVVHAGQTEIEATDIVELEKFALAGLVAVAKRLDQFRTPAELYEWMLQRSFNPGDVPQSAPSPAEAVADNPGA